MSPYVVSMTYLSPTWRSAIQTALDLGRISGTKHRVTQASVSPAWWTETGHEFAWRIAPITEESPC